MSSISHDLPWLAAAERIYGPLAEAFGLRPAREAFEAWQVLATAHFEEIVANAQVGAVVAAGAFDGLGRVAKRLDSLHTEGLTIDSPTALLRAGMREFDGAMHAAMLSEPGLAATAASVRAGSRRRVHLQKLAALAAEAAGQPTRVEVDEAFREIQQLKREVRELKRTAARAPSAGRRA